jgi:hypothetical protein
MIYFRVLWQLLLILPEMFRTYRDIEKYFAEKKREELEAEKARDRETIRKIKESSDLEETKKLVDSLGNPNPKL